MPRTGTGSMAESRVSISFAALLVKVTASTPPGESWPVWISQAMRVVSTRVLPEPAPARISDGRAGKVTAASCSGFSPRSRLSDDGTARPGSPSISPVAAIAAPTGSSSSNSGIDGSSWGATPWLSEQVGIDEF